MSTASTELLFSRSHGHFPGAVALGCNGCRRLRHGMVTEAAFPFPYGTTPTTPVAAEVVCSLGRAGVGDRQRPVVQSNPSALRQGVHFSRIQ